MYFDACVDECHDQVSHTPAKALLEKRANRELIEAEGRQEDLHLRRMPIVRAGLLQLKRQVHCYLVGVSHLNIGIFVLG